MSILNNLPLFKNINSSNNFLFNFNKLDNLNKQIFQFRNKKFINKIQRNKKQKNPLSMMIQQHQDKYQNKKELYILQGNKNKESQ